MTPARWAAIRALAERNSVPVAERIARHSGEPTENGCIEWTGAVDRRGYARLTVNGSSRTVTQYVLEMAGKPKPSRDHLACHSCDNPACINQDHLWWGTQSDNMKDCFAKGRAHVEGLATGWKNGRPAKTIEERFEGLTDRGAPDECWMYKGKTNRDGYGVFCVGRGTGKEFTAHRLAYELHNGSAATGAVLHSCGNKRCVNPRHLKVREPAPFVGWYS